MKKNVTAIVPAYNEEATIADVVRPLAASRYIHDVIVVSDGSTDRTADIAKENGAYVYELKQNGGKGEAMLFGISKTSAPIVAFFDADLIKLTEDHIEQLVLPVLSGSRMMNVGLRDRGPVGTFIAKHLPLIGGERVMLRQVIDGVNKKYLKGYMVESALNYYCRSRGYNYGAVYLRDLSIRRKYQKVTLFQAVIQYLHMFSQVARAMVTVRLARLRRKF